MKQFIAILVFTVCLATSAKAQTFLNDLVNNANLK